MADDTATVDTATTETVVDSTAAATTEATTTATVDTTAAATTAVTPEPKFLGRFHTAEQLEAYAQGLEKSQAQPARTTQPVAAQTAAPTLDQLKFSKAHWRTEAFKAQSAGDADAFQKASANVDWCDEQIYDGRLAQESKKWQGQGAADSLLKEGAELLKPYQADLVPGNPLYETAMTYFNQAKQALESGASIDQILSGLTVLAAAQKTGKTTAGVTQKATANFAEALNKAAKTAIVTGGGAAAKMESGKITPEKLNAMSDTEFAKYEADILAQSKTVPWSRYQRS